MSFKDEELLTSSTSKHTLGTEVRILWNSAEM